jgi:8-oxo-dGTP diphosphatase
LTINIVRGTIRADMVKNIPKKVKHLKFAVLAVDVVLFTIKDSELFVRLINVNRPPAFPDGSHGFPGGLVKPKETAEESARRILKEKGGIDSKKVYFEQLYTFSSIDRDPRGRVVSVSYIGLVSWDKLNGGEIIDSKDHYWEKIGGVGKLAYDHNEMLRVALQRLKSKVSYTNAIGKIMPAKFTLGELERAYNCILGEKQDKRNFRKKITKLNILKELPDMLTGEPFRPAKLYSFRSLEVKEIELI